MQKLHWAVAGTALLLWGCSLEQEPVGGVQAALFDANVHGFGFQNYSNEHNPVNLTAEEVHRMFGDRVCASGSGPTCSLTPTAAQWMQQVSNGMNGGHCEGMAVLSLRIEQGLDSHTNYGANASNTFDLALEGNDRLTREIGYWFALQGVAPVSSAETRTPPSEVVRLLEEALDTGNEAYTLGFYKPGFQAGHAVTPIDVVDGDNGTEILVYDNNFPGQTRSILVDEENETWEYSAAASPDVAESAYHGDASTKTLGLTPLSVRQGTLECPFCGDYQAGMAANRNVSVTGDASLLITDENGNQIGHTSDGELVNSIPGASFGAQRSDDLWQDRQEPVYLVPGGSGLELAIGDGGDGSLDPSDVAVVGPGYYLGIENIVLEPGQIDGAFIGRDTTSISYVTDGLETPDIVLAVETAAADWIVVVRSRGDSGGQQIDASVDFADGGTLSLFFAGTDAESEFDLYLTRVDDTTVVDFGTDMVRVPNGAALTLRFADFDTDGEGLVLGVDSDGDMMPDTMVDLADTGGLPMNMNPMNMNPMNPMNPMSPPARGSDGGGCSVSPNAPASGFATLSLVFGILVLIGRRRF
ncbi:MAG: hypothetical protein AAGF12_02635 [Myxococcota bacterium]